MDTMNCIICSSDTKKCFDVFDDRYGYQGLFELVECTACGHKLLKAFFSKEELTRLYTDCYPRSTFDVGNFHQAPAPGGWIGWFNGVRRSAYAWVPRNVRILDIGCGFGESLAYHRARGCDVYGVEADENIRRIADAHGFKVQVGLFDPAHYPPASFDYVTMDQVIEHVADPLLTLQDIAQVLKVGGRAILSTPNASGWGARLFGRRWINWHAPYHLQHFSRGSMQIAAEKVGLSIESVKTLTSSEWLHYQWIHLLTMPDQGKPSPFWSPKATPGFSDTLVMKLLALLHRSKFNHIVTRLFDMIGVGDNYLFFLRKP